MEEAESRKQAQFRINHIEVCFDLLEEAVLNRHLDRCCLDKASYKNLTSFFFFFFMLLG